MARRDPAGGSTKAAGRPATRPAQPGGSNLRPGSTAGIDRAGQRHRDPDQGSPGEQARVPRHHAGSLQRQGGGIQPRTATSPTAWDRCGLRQAEHRSSTGKGAGTRRRSAQTRSRCRGFYERASTPAKQRTSGSSTVQTGKPSTPGNKHIDDHQVNRRAAEGQQAFLAATASGRNPATLQSNGTDQGGQTRRHDARREGPHHRR